MLKNKNNSTLALWHKDVKWLFAILALIALHITLLGINLYRLTAEKVAVPLEATIIASTFSPDGLDDPKPIEDVKRLLKNQDSISPIPGINLKITKSDLEGKTPREARVAVFAKLALPLYREGKAGVAKLVTDPKTQASVESGVSLLTIISQKNHDIIGNVVKIAGLICLLLLAGVIFFSRRWGRIFSPGLIITLASLPGAIISFLLTTALRLHPAATTVARDASVGDKFGAIWQVIGPDAAAILSKTYQTALAVGFGLMILSIIGKIIYRLTDRRKA